MLLGLTFLLAGCPKEIERPAPVTSITPASGYRFAMRLYYSGDKSVVKDTVVEPVVKDTVVEQPAVVVEKKQIIEATKPKPLIFTNYHFGKY